MKRLTEKEKEVLKAKIEAERVRKHPRHSLSTLLINSLVVIHKKIQEVYKHHRTIVENKKQKGEKPSLSVGRIIGEILAGGAGGLAVGGLITVFLVRFFPGEFGLLILLVFLIPIIYPLGSAIGVYLVGNIGNEKGSFLATLGFSFLGGFVTFMGWKCLESGGWYTVIPGTLYLLAAPICATIGFNLTRRYKFVLGAYQGVGFGFTAGLLAGVQGIGLMIVILLGAAIGGYLGPKTDTTWKKICLIGGAVIATVVLGYHIVLLVWAYL